MILLRLVEHHPFITTTTHHVHYTSPHWVPTKNEQCTLSIPPLPTLLSLQPPFVSSLHIVHNNPPSLFFPIFPPTSQSSLANTQPSWLHCRCALYFFILPNTGALLCLHTTNKSMPMHANILQYIYRNFKNVCRSIYWIYVSPQELQMWKTSQENDAHGCHRPLNFGFVGVLFPKRQGIVVKRKEKTEGERSEEESMCLCFIEMKWKFHHIAPPMTIYLIYINMISVVWSEIFVFDVGCYFLGRWVMWWVSEWVCECVCGIGCRARGISKKKEETKRKRKGKKKKGVQNQIACEV